MNEAPKKFFKTNWYRIEIFKEGRWVDAGNVFEEQSKTMCRKEFNSVNFFGQKVRMVKYVNTWKLDGVVEEKDFR